MGNYHFSRLPAISIPRTKMKQSFTHSTSFNFAKIVPIDCFEVLPGDSYSLKLSSIIRMTQPIVPLMDNLECEIHAFFVPMRLVYKHTQEFLEKIKIVLVIKKKVLLFLKLILILVLVIFLII